MDINYFSSDTGCVDPNSRILVETHVDYNCKFVTIGTKLSYKILIRNNSDFDLENVYITNNIISELQYQKDTLRINGIEPFEGDIDLNSEYIIPLGIINKNATIIITFDVVIECMPSQYPIINYVRLMYSFNNDGQLYSNSKVSNYDYTYFNVNCDRYKILQYVENNHICSKNPNSDVKINIIIKPIDTIYSTILEECLNENLEFVSATLYYNSILKKELILDNNSLNIGKVNAMDKAEVVIIAKIKNNVEEKNIKYIENNPYIKYHVNSIEEYLHAYTNPIYIYLQYAHLDGCAGFEDNYANSYETEFCIRLNQCGTGDIYNLLIENVIPSHLDYIENSATILYNDCLKYSLDYNQFENSVCIPVIGINEEIAICFKVAVCHDNVKNIPTKDIYLNYQYLVCPKHKSTDSIYDCVENQIINNQCCMQRLSADLLSTLRKEITSENNCGSNNIDYSITFTNTGELTACNILIEDILSGASFSQNSLKVYTDTPMGCKPYYGKMPRISIKSVYPGETIKIIFSAFTKKNQPCKVVTNYANIYYQYSENEYHQPINTHGRSNTVNYEIEDKIDSKLTLDSNLSFEAEVGSNIVYRIKIENTSDVELKDVVYKLSLSDGYENYIKYKENSFKVIGSSEPIKDINPNTTPMVLGNILPKQKIMIEFIEIAIKPTTLPIISFASGKYSYKKANTGDIISCIDETNRACLNIVNPIAVLDKKAYSYCPENILGCVEKPISSVALGDTITYKLPIINNSECVLEDVTLYDELPIYTKYIDGSLKINNNKVNYEFTNPLCLPNIAPKEELLVSFDVVVVSIPKDYTITNNACIEYKYAGDLMSSSHKYGKYCTSNNLDVLYADLSQNAVKSSSPKTVSINDPAFNNGIYTVTLTNSGNIDALNVKFVDKLPTGLKFTPNSVVVKGVDKNNNTVPLIVNSVPPGGVLNIENGIIIEKIPPSVSVIIKYGFNVEANAPAIIKNTASFDYSFIANGVVVNKPNNNTSTDTLTVVNDILNISQVLSPSTVCPGDIILCSINISNLSSDDINNLILQSTIPKNTTLVPSSFTIDLKPVTPTVTSSDIAKGVDIGTLRKPPNGSKLIQYQLRVTDSTINPIVSTNNIYYKTSSGKSKTYTETSSISISNNCPVSPTSFVDISKTAFSYCASNSNSCTVHPVTIVSVNDRVTYSVDIKNTSKLDLTEMVFEDILPPGVSYIKNSLKVNGITIPNDFINGLPLGTLKVGESSKVSFDVIVVSIPKPNNVINIACVTYKYKENCIGCSEQKRTDCASNTLKVVSPQLQTNFFKYVDNIGTTENFKKPYDGISYIIQFENSGNEDAYNAVLIDTIPNEVGYFLNSIVVTPSVPAINISQPTGDDYVLRIKFDTIPKGVKYTVTFKGQVQTTLPSGTIYNNAYLNYSYLSNATNTIATSTATSNTVITHINSANLVINKAASASEVDINTPVTYTIKIKNTGNMNANNIYLKDLLPSLLQYIPNTLKVNGIPSSADINSGILIGTLQPEGFATIEFKVLAKNAPQFNPISNTAEASYTYISNPLTGKEESAFAISNQVLLFVKAADLLTVLPTKESDTLVVSPNNPANNSGNYAISLYNAGNTDAINVLVIDTLPKGISFVPNSVVVTGKDKNGNNVPLKANSIPPGGSLNIENGINIENIPPYVTANIKFGFIATSKEFDFAENTANFNYSYAVNQTLVTVPNVPTTTATIAVVNDALKVTKLVEGESACPGQTLLYTITIENRISVTIANVVVQDTIPSVLSLVPGTFTLNFKEFMIGGRPVTSSNLAQGVNIGTLPLANKHIVQFLATVSQNAKSCEPIVNTANVRYTNTTVPSSIYSSTVVTTVPMYCPSPCPPPCDCDCGCNSNCNSCKEVPPINNNRPTPRNKRFSKQSNLNYGKFNNY